MKLRILLFCFLISTFSVSKSQGIEVSGKVTDSGGMGIPGVNVMKKGTQDGVVSNDSGEYSIKANKGDILVFSFIGYKSSEVEVSLATHNVVLESDMVEIDEVVVTALGIKKQKKALGYSVSELKGEGISSSKETNIINSISGKVAGVQISKSSTGVGSSSRIVIRGNNSFKGNNQPLFVVDGIPIDNSTMGQPTAGDEYDGDSGFDMGNAAADINPEDIESISILKGANAAALYGSRAANGVVLITTKKGTARKGIGVSVTSSVMFEQAYLFPEFQNEYGKGRIGTIRGKYGPDFVATDGLDINRLGDDKTWGAKMEGQDYYKWDREFTKSKYESQPNMVEDFYELGKTFNNVVSLSGGNDKMTSFLSLGRMTNKGIIPTSELERTTINLRTTVQLSKKLSFDGKVTYISQEAHNRANASGGGSMAWLMNTMPRSVSIDDLKNYEYGPFDPAKIPAAIPESIRGRRDPRTNSRFYWWSEGSPVVASDVGSFMNPYWILHKRPNDDKKDQYQGFVSLTYKFTDWLSLMVRTGQDYYTISSSTKYSYYDKAGWEGRMSESEMTVKELNSDFLLSANKKITEKINLSGSFGGNTMKNERSHQGYSSNKFVIPNFFHPSNFKEGGLISKSKYEKRVNSLYATAQFGYDNFWFVDFAARNDWSSTLPSNNRSYFYPSVSSSIILNDILNLDKEIFSFVKLRGSWAQVGNDTDPYQLTPYYYTSKFNGEVSASINSTLPLANLKPEITTSYEFGADLRLWKGLANIDFTYYKSITKNQIVSTESPTSTGYSSRNMNAGEIQNSGVELMLTLNPIRNKDFDWSMSVNFAKNNSEVIDVLGDENIDFLNIATISGFGSYNAYVRAIKGKPYGALVGKKIQRNNEGLAILDAHGIPLATEDYHVMGNYNPDWTAGISNTLKYKNWSFNFLIDIKHGGEIFTRTGKTMNRAGTSKESVAGRDAFYNSPEFLALPDGKARSSLRSASGGVDLWTKGNAVFSDNDLPKDANGNQIGGDVNSKVYVSPRIYHEEMFKRGIMDDAVKDASYVKLRELSLTYKLPSAWAKKAKLAGASLSFIGRNLFIFHKNTTHIDPEAGYNNGNAQGVEANSLPSTRTYGFSVNLKF